MTGHDAFDGVLDVPGASLACWDSGGPGEPVVLLHPGTGTAETWAPQREPLAAAGYRAIAVTRRGHAGSSPVDPADPGSAVGDLCAVLDALGVASAHVVGAAGGGITAVDLALARPERVRSLVLAGSILGVTDPAWRAAIAALGLLPNPGLPHEVVEVGPSYRAEDPAGLARWREIERSAQIGGVLRPQPVLSDISWAALAGLRMPVLLVGGGADLLVPSPLVEVAAAHIPGAMTAHIPDAGHAMAWERPARFNQIVLEFVREVDGVSAAPPVGRERS